MVILGWWILQPSWISTGRVCCNGATRIVSNYHSPECAESQGRLQGIGHSNRIKQAGWSCSIHWFKKNKKHFYNFTCWCAILP